MQIDSIHDLASAARGRRLDLGLSQADLAVRAGVSRQWLNAFEGGKPTAELGLAMRLLDALGLRLEVYESDGGEGRPARGAGAGGGVDLDALLEEYGEG